MTNRLRIGKTARLLTGAVLALQLGIAMPLARASYEEQERPPRQLSLKESAERQAGVLEKCLKILRACTVAAGCYCAGETLPQPNPNPPKIEDRRGAGPGK